MVEIKGGKFITPQFFDAMHSCFENIVLPSGMRFHDMTDCAFSHCGKNQADLRGLSIESSSFELCELTGVMLNDVRVKRSTFFDCHMEKSVMNLSEYAECEFINCYFDDADILKGSFQSCTFIHCEFMDAYFYGANMTDCCLDQFSMESLRASKTKNYDGINYEVRASEEGDVLYVERHAFA